jgi:hypothetical protein
MKPGDKLYFVGHDTARELCGEVQRLHELRDAALAWYDAEHAAARLDPNRTWEDGFRAMQASTAALTRVYEATKAIKEEAGNERTRSGVQPPKP